jgi:hypothetical protein
MHSRIFKLYLCILGVAATPAIAFGYGAGSKNPEEKACKKILELEGVSLENIQMPDLGSLRAEHARLLASYNASKKTVQGERKAQIKFLKEFYEDLRADGMLKKLRGIASAWTPSEPGPAATNPDLEDPRTLLQIKFNEAFRYFHLKKNHWTVNYEEVTAFTKRDNVFLKRTHEYDHERDVIRFCTESEGIMTIRSCSLMSLKTGEVSSSYSEDLGAEKRWIRNGKVVSINEYVSRRLQETFEHGLQVEGARATKLSTRCKPYLAQLLMLQRR